MNDTNDNDNENTPTDTSTLSSLLLMISHASSGCGDTKSQSQNSSPPLSSDESRLTIILQSISELSEPDHLQHYFENDNIDIIRWTCEHLNGDDDDVVNDEDDGKNADTVLLAKDEPNDENFKEWRDGLILLGIILRRSEYGYIQRRPNNNGTMKDSTPDKGDTSNVTYPNTHMMIGEQMPMSNPITIPPHMLLRETMDSAMSYIRMIRIQEESQHIHVHVSMHAIVYLHLTTVALRAIIGQVSIFKSGTRLSSSTNNPVRMRWKRIQSMCMESICLFQTFTSVIATHLHDDTNDNELEILVTFFVEYFSPTVIFLLSILMDRVSTATTTSESNSNIPNQNKNTLIVAGIIQIITELSSLLMEREERNLKGRDASSSMIKSLLNIAVVRIQNLPVAYTPEFIFMHPLRLNQNQSVTPFEYQKEKDEEDNEFNGENEYGEDEDDEVNGEFDEYDAMKQAEEALMNDFVRYPLLCHEKEEFGLEFDALCGMNICWNSNGITFMAAHSILPCGDVGGDADNRGDLNANDGTYSEEIINKYGSNLLVPHMHSPGMIYSIYFPHATDLISMSHTETSTPSANASCFRYLDMGMEILHYLHGFLEPCSLNETFNGDNELDHVSQATAEPSTSSSAYFINGPLSPVGIIQLLLNTLINISSSIGASSSKPLPGQGEGERQLSMASNPEKSPFMTPQGIISTIRNILRVYQNHTQISVITKLIQTSPFPFLIPILLDLTRNIVASDIKSIQEKREIMVMVIHILSPIVSEMASCFDETGLDVSGRSDEFICDEDRLMEGIETFCSAVSLVRLVFLALESESGAFSVKRQVLDMISKIGTFQENLHSQLKEWSMKQEELPHEMFRVHLLENALIDLFTVVAAREIPAISPSI